ncbi:unnamed protein product [Caenorhabditis sp. 36 PRJEB53466]|nr:unnamed protein product [Caenorhabditis sp. 36 PRJEB53466]
MTVSYSLSAATASAWAWVAILCRWKGSIWKLIWIEAIAWTVLTAFLYVLYVHVFMGTDFEQTYKNLVDITKDVPTDGTLMFLLSYMTYNSLNRWSDTFKCLAWPENVALCFKQYFNPKSVTKHEEKCYYRTVARYLTVCYILIFRDVSAEVREMFETIEHLVVHGILTAEEAQLLQSSRLEKHSCHYWIPINWIVVIVRNKYKPELSADGKGRKNRQSKESIMTEIQYMKFITEINRLRARVGDVLAYDWVPLPLALFQCLTIFVYGTMIVNCFQMQARIVMSEKSGISDLFVESMSTLPINMLYLGFLRISQVIINPFGKDDDDFEALYLIDRHITVLNEILSTEDDEKDKEKDDKKKKEKKENEEKKTELKTQSK